MKLLPDKSVDLVLTDLPYGVGVKYDLYHDTEENYLELMTRFIPEARRVGKMAIFPCGGTVKLKWFYASGLDPDWWIVWDKGSTSIATPIGLNDYELLAVYGRGAKPMHDLVRAPLAAKTA